MVKEKTKNNVEFNIQDSILKLEDCINKPRKKLEPFWNEKCSELSSRLWIPNESESVAKKHILTDGWNKNYHIYPEEEIEEEYDFKFVKPITSAKKEAQKVKSRKGKKHYYRTIKLLLYCNKKQKEILEKWFGYQRWYYNCALDIVNQGLRENHYEFNDCFHKDNKGEYSLIQDKTRDYIKHYTMDLEAEPLFEYPSFQRKYTYAYEPDRFKFYTPEWMQEEKKTEKHPYERIIRGGIKRFVGAFNSALTNRQRGYNKGFTMQRKTKKDYISTVFFDAATSRPEIIPSSFGDVKAFYPNRGVKIPLLNLNLKKDCAFTIIYDKIKNKYFLSVPEEYIPLNESQSAKDVISLDPGVRCFQTGYSPTKGIFEFSTNNSRIWNLLKGLYRLQSLYDKSKRKRLSKKIVLKRRRIRNLVTDMHRKTANFLVENFSVILLPEFRTQDMVKGKKLNKKTKSLLNIHRFYEFKQFLMYKAFSLGKQCLIVDEAFTSQTCVCGELTKTSLKVFSCDHCGFTCDRDHKASRNILIKNTVSI